MPTFARPAKIRTEKLSVNTLIPGAAFPRTAKVKVTIKFTAISGAAIWTPTRKILPVLLTKSSAMSCENLSIPMGAISKLRRNAANTR